MTKEDIGFILAEFIVANGSVWLFGLDLNLAQKLIYPNVMMAAMIGHIVACKLMGLD